MGRLIRVVGGLMLAVLAFGLPVGAWNSDFPGLFEVVRFLLVGVSLPIMAILLGIAWDLATSPTRR